MAASSASPAVRVNARKVEERGRDVRMVRPKRLLRDAQGALVEWPRGDRRRCVRARSEIGRRGRNVRMIRTEELLLSGQCALKERPGASVILRLERMAARFVRLSVTRGSARPRVLSRIATACSKSGRSSAS